MKKLFAIVAGPRLAGKTTIAGTLPGKTVLLQAAVLESGSRSAAKLAAKRGNTLVTDGYVFTDLVDFWPKLQAAYESDADHIYIDGYSAINDMRWGMDDMQRLATNDQWKAFGKHGQEMVNTLRKIKEYSYGDKNVFVTCALKVEVAANGVADVKLECRGKMAVTEISKIGEAVLTIVKQPTEQGMKRVIVTNSDGTWPGRIDGVLDDDNPNVTGPDLSEVLALLKESDQ